MIITLKKEISEEHEITLPMYLCYGDIHYYKIISEEETIHVCDAKYTGVAISMIPTKAALLNGYDIISEELFSTKFEYVIDQLKKKEYFI